MGLMRGGWIDHQKHTFDVLGTYVLVPVRVPVHYMEDIKYQRFYIKEIKKKRKHQVTHTVITKHANTTTNENT